MKPKFELELIVNFFIIEILDAKTKVMEIEITANAVESFFNIF